MPGQRHRRPRDRAASFALRSRPNVRKFSSIPLGPGDLLARGEARPRVLRLSLLRPWQRRHRPAAEPAGQRGSGPWARWAHPITQRERSC